MANPTKKAPPVERSYQADPPSCELKLQPVIMRWLNRTAMPGGEIWRFDDESEGSIMVPNEFYNSKQARVLNAEYFALLRKAVLEWDEELASAARDMGK